MAEQAFDTQGRVKRTEELVRQTAAQLHDILVEMAAALVPFPYFMGSTEVQAVEAEPGGAGKADHGCVVLCADGEMYELTMRIEGTSAGFDIGVDREDSVKRIELAPEDYIGYAFNAIKEIAGLLEEKQARAKKYSF